MIKKKKQKKKKKKRGLNFLKVIMLKNIVIKKNPNTFHLILWQFSCDKEFWP